MTPELDERFSAPEASPVPWTDTERVLDAAELFWISTVRADGRPHVTPLVGVWLDGALHFSTGPEEQKAHNLAANPQVVLTTGCNGWDDGLDVVVEGEAVRITDDATLRRLAHAWAAKWDGRWTFGVAEGGFTHPEDDVDADHGPVFVYGVRPAKVLAFGKGTFSHTRYRFDAPGDEAA
jgi:nitroimidazol reductase NimA-like FMN-containing flavoprotein (pyridoxamine 5'-phosphate oxidase superfamily)